MSKHRGRWNQKPRPPVHPPLKKASYNLDIFTLADIRQGKARQQALSRFHWGQYSEFAYQRSLILDEIKKALMAAAVKPWPFSDFQRAVKYKWAFDPLSFEGSVKDIGGRFNIGNIDRTKFPPFPALYLGQNKDTALQEMLQFDTSGKSGLTAQELALTNPDSIAFVNTFGSLESVIDLDLPDNLKSFIDLIKDFKYSKALQDEAKKIGITIEINDTAVRSIEQLLSAVYEPNWRSLPMHMDVPASCQIFGQLVSEAGIEGIHYKSKYTKKSCLAIFPQNFLSVDSFVELKDQCPPEVKNRRLEFQPT